MLFPCSAFSFPTTYTFSPGLSWSHNFFSWQGASMGGLLAVLPAGSFRTLAGSSENDEEEAESLALIVQHPQCSSFCCASLASIPMAIPQVISLCASTCTFSSFSSTVCYLAVMT